MVARASTPGGTPPARVAYAVAVLAVGAASLVAWLVGDTIAGAIALQFFMAVVVSAWFGGFRPGLLATVLAAVVCEVWFHPPLFGVDWGTALRLGMFSIVAALTSSLYANSQKAHREAERLLAEEQRARADAETANRAKDSPRICGSRIARTIATLAGSA